MGRRRLAWAPAGCANGAKRSAAPLWGWVGWGGVGWDGLAMSKGGRLLLLMERFLDGDEIWISIAFSGIFLYYVLNMLTPLPVRTARSGWAFCFYVGTLLFYAGTVYKATFKL